MAFSINTINKQVLKCAHLAISKKEQIKGKKKAQFYFSCFSRKKLLLTHFSYSKIQWYKVFLHVVFYILVKELQHIFKTRQPLLTPVSLWTIIPFSYTETVFLQQLYFYIQMYFLYAPVIIFYFNLHNSIRIMEYFNTFF